MNTKLPGMSVESEVESAISRLFDENDMNKYLSKKQVESVLIIHLNELHSRAMGDRLNVAERAWNAAIEAYKKQQSRGEWVSESYIALAKSKFMEDEQKQ